jgi:subfamily B ATP-binding cassette protein MsbA
MSSKDLYLRQLRYIKPYYRAFAAAIFGIVLLAATEPMLPALMKPLLDGSFVAKDPTYIAVMPVLIVSVFLIRGIAGFLGSVAMQWVANKVVMELRTEMFAKLLVLPDQRFSDIPSGILLSKFTYDVNQVMHASTQALVVLIRDSLAIIGLVGWIFYLNWQLSLSTFLILPGIAIVVRIISRRLRRTSRALQAAIGNLNHVVDEALRGHRVIKVFAGKTYEKKRFHEVNNRVRRYSMKLLVASEASVPIVQTLAVGALAIVIYIASQQAVEDVLTVGSFVSLFGAMAMMLAPIKRLTKLNEPLQRGLAAAESVFAFIDEPAEADNGKQSPAAVEGKIDFQAVYFHYRADTAAVLKNICLNVQAGETIALVGTSGSGKTSLVNLLPRFYDCSRGAVLLDGTDIRQLSLETLRSNIAYVGQNIVLFNDTVAANITYGTNREVSHEKLQAAAKHAYALEFIQALPQGFDTLIGENGTRLSGGQRQRIAIARAILKDAPILILDEATSALDTQSERQVQRALESLREGRTSFVVAHRLSTIESADRIVVFDDGEIVEMGTHHELIKLGGFYAKLHEIEDYSANNK